MQSRDCMVWIVHLQSVSEFVPWRGQEVQLMRQEKKLPEEALFEKPKEAIAFDKMTNLHQFAQDYGWLG